MHDLDRNYFEVLLLKKCPQVFSWFIKFILLKLGFEVASQIKDISGLLKSVSNPSLPSPCPGATEHFCKGSV